MTGPFVAASLVGAGVITGNPATVTDVPLDPADARRLTRLGKAVDRYTTERNDLIRRLIAEGAGVREVARAVGLAPATVLNIVKPKVRR